MYYGWSKEFPEAGKKRLSGDGYTCKQLYVCLKFQGDKTGQAKKWLSEKI
jgi:hypothetical protein